MYETQHYKDCTVRFTKTYQPIDAIRNMPFSLGCAVKYLCRAGHKGDILEDYKKACDYLCDVRDHLKGNYYCCRHIKREDKQALIALAGANDNIHKLFETWLENYEQDPTEDIYVTYNSLEFVIGALNEYCKGFKDVFGE